MFCPAFGCLLLLLLLSALLLLAVVAFLLLLLLSPLVLLRLQLLFLQQGGRRVALFGFDDKQRCGRNGHWYAVIPRPHGLGGQYLAIWPLTALTAVVIRVVCSALAGSFRPGAPLSTARALRVGCWHIARLSVGHLS